MAALGCPVAGDRKYGFRARAGERFPRVMLHSFRLRFVHPATEREVAVVAPPPESVLSPF
jgi:23S rRNA pseudouridine1911/1915/1917 synthase